MGSLLRSSFIYSFFFFLPPPPTPPLLLFRCHLPLLHSSVTAGTLNKRLSHCRHTLSLHPSLRSPSSCFRPAGASDTTRRKTRRKKKMKRGKKKKIASAPKPRERQHTTASFVLGFVLPTRIFVGLFFSPSLSLFFFSPFFSSHFCAEIIENRECWKKKITIIIIEKESHFQGCFLRVQQET